MTRWVQTVVHLLALLGKAGALLLPALKPQYRVTVVVILGAVQMAAGQIAQAFNTDGTPQAVAFQPEQRKGGFVQ